MQLPIELIKQIDKIIRSRKCGYISRTDFVREAVRAYLAEKQRNHDVLELWPMKAFEVYGIFILEFGIDVWT